MFKQRNDKGLNEFSDNMNHKQTRSIVMKLLTNLIVVIAVLFSTSVSADTNGTANVVPIIKQHHAALMASGENNISTTVFEGEMKDKSIITAKVMSMRNGSDFQDFFEQSRISIYEEPNTLFSMSQSFPTTPYQNYESISVYDTVNIDGFIIYWWGDQVWSSATNSYHNALHPIIQTWRTGIAIDTVYTLTTEINLGYDYQNEFIIQYGYFDRIGSNGYYTYYPVPDASQSDIYDQLGWPVYVETWDLRPNLHSNEISLHNNNGLIGTDNPPIMDSTLYAVAMTEEDAGFWAGVTDVQFYLDDSPTSFYQTTTVEIDSGGTSTDTSSTFSLNSVGAHSIRVVVNQDSAINETDSADNEMIFYFNVVSMSDTPAVAINTTEYNDWNNVSIAWFGSSLINDNLEYHYKLDADTWSTWDTTTSTSYINLSSGEHTFYVEVASSNGLMDSDSITFIVESAVEIVNIHNTTITYGQTLEFDLAVTGGSGTYNYGAVYGTVDASGHYSWTPAYNSDPYSEVITASCQTWPNNTASDGFLIEVTLSDVVIAGLDSNYVVLEEDVLSNSDITATGGDNSSYNWTLTANTADGDWLTLTSSSGAVTGFAGTVPSLYDAMAYDYTLSCVSQTQAAALNFSVTAWPFISFTVDPSYNFSHNNDSQIQLIASGGDGSNFTWTVSDANLLTIDSTQGDQVWLSANTSNMGTFQVDVSCSQANLPGNNHTEQVNFTVEQGLWAVEPMAILFPTVQTTQTVVVRNISGSESMTYALTLDSWSSYDILSELSGNLSAGQSDTVQIVSHENNTPYTRIAQLTININGGAYTPVVGLTIAASNTSLQAFAFNGGTSASQALTIWNNTGSEQSVSLSNGNDSFYLSTDATTLAAGAFAVIYISALETDEVLYDTLHVVSADINSRILLQKNPSPLNSMAHDDGLPQGTIGHNNAIVNLFTIVANDHLTGIEVYLRQNNQTYNWIVLDGDFNTLADGVCTNGYIGWQQINLPTENQPTDGDYYIGVQAISENDNVYVGYDPDSQSESYWYNNGSFELLTGTAFIRALTTGVVSITNEEIIPKQFSLNQNYPNPFNPSTTITYSLASETDVRLTIYSLTGQVVAMPINSKQSVGNYTVNVNMSNYGLSSGIYFYRLTTPEFQAVKKLMFIK